MNTDTREYLISILIPIYNCDCTDLLKTLLYQISIASQPIEIVVLDDHSTTQHIFQNILRGFDCAHLSIQRNDRNLGRAGTRNRLAQLAKGSHLLFIDGDSEISRGFLSNYIRRLPLTDTVLVGGTAYPERIKQPDNSLHWYYGRKRETKSKTFQSNNFLLTSELFDKIQFDKRIKHYGHEDTLFGLKLQELGIRIHRINNPAIHNGLETNENFIHKQLEAASTHVQIMNRGQHLNSQLEKVYRLICRFAILRTFSNRMLDSLEPHLTKYLLTHPRQLWALQLLKLHAMLTHKDRV